MGEVIRTKNVRWRIAVLLCLVSGLNCLDRNTLAILASTIQMIFIGRMLIMQISLLYLCLAIR